MNEPSSQELDVETRSLRSTEWPLRMTPHGHNPGNSLWNIRRHQLLPQIQGPLLQGSSFWKGLPLLNLNESTHSMPSSVSALLSEVTQNKFILSSLWQPLTHLKAAVIFFLLLQLSFPLWFTSLTLRSSHHEFKLLHAIMIALSLSEWGPKWTHCVDSQSDNAQRQTTSKQSRGFEV